MKVATSKFGLFALSAFVSSGFACMLVGTASAATSSETSGSKITQDVITTMQTTTTVELHADKVAVITGDEPTSNDAATSVSEVHVSGGSLVDQTAAHATISKDSAASGDEAAAAVAESPEQATVVADKQTQPVATTIVSTHAPAVFAAPVVVRATVSASQSALPMATAAQSESAQQPLPDAPKTHGNLLATLTHELAGTVVPQLFELVTFAATTLPVGATSTLVIILVSLFVALFAGSYVTLLARSGYLSAARSNVSLLTFATPGFMGRGVLIAPTAFLNGVRDQKNPVRAIA